jgi:hypothetical protein
MDQGKQDSEITALFSLIKIGTPVAISFSIRDTPRQ